MSTESSTADLNSLSVRIKEFKEKLDKPGKSLFNASEVNERVKRRVRKAMQQDGA